jgi:hypothetical protein
LYWLWRGCQHFAASVSLNMQTEVPSLRTCFCLSRNQLCGVSHGSSMYCCSWQPHVGSAQLRHGFNLPSSALHISKRSDADFAAYLTNSFSNDLSSDPQENVLRSLLAGHEERQAATLQAKGFRPRKRHRCDRYGHNPLMHAAPVLVSLDLLLMGPGQARHHVDAPHVD